MTWHTQVARAWILLDRRGQHRTVYPLTSDALVGDQVVGTAFALDVKFADEIGCGLRGLHCEKRKYADMCTLVLPKYYLNRRALFASA